MTKKIDRSDVLAILAVLVSLSALVVALYETRILRDQSNMMQAQQKASVWPFLETNANYSFNEMSQITISVKNKGVGPAKIQQFEMLVDAQVFTNHDSLRTYLQDQLRDVKTMSLSMGSLGEVLGQGELVQIFQMAVTGNPHNEEVLKNLDFKVMACYCSIYKECWLLDSDTSNVMAVCQ